MKGILKLAQTIVYLILLGCALSVLGIYAYFIATLADRSSYIAPWIIIVVCIAGAATLYLLFGVIFTCCLGGIRLFSYLAIVLDLFFAGCFIAVAVLTRDGASSCNGFVETPLGNGPEDSGDPGYGTDGFGLDSGENVVYKPRLETACDLNKACFCLAILASILFFFSALHQMLLARTRQREKVHENRTTDVDTTGRAAAVPFWKKRFTPTSGARDTETGLTGTAVTGVAPVPAGSNLGYTTEKPAHDIRPSHDTAYTGSTVAPANSHFNKYDQQPATAGQNQAAYYTAPTTTTTTTY